MIYIDSNRYPQDEHDRELADFDYALQSLEAFGKHSSYYPKIQASEDENKEENLQFSHPLPKSYS